MSHPSRSCRLVVRVCAHVRVHVCGGGEGCMCVCVCVTSLEVSHHTFQCPIKVVIIFKKTTTTPPPLGPPGAWQPHIWICPKQHLPHSGGWGPGEKQRGLSMECGDCGTPSSRAQRADAREVFQAFDRLHISTLQTTELAGRPPE